MKQIIVYILLISTQLAISQGKKTIISPNQRTKAHIINHKKSEATEESQIKIISKNGIVLFDTSFISDDGEHGLGIARALWTPNSQYFIFSTYSSGGHQSWHSPTFFYSVQANKLYFLDDFVGPITDSEFEVSGRDSVYIVCKRRDNLDEENVAISLSRLIHTK
jgi:hypothetical protein